MAQFVETFDPGAETTILDVGGTPMPWELINSPSQITLLNLTTSTFGQSGWDRYTFVQGDGTNLDFADRSFEIGYSNSVIEHVGRPEAQARFAAELRRVADGLWVQTPARSFFLEPHYLTPFVHWLPKAARRRIVRNLTVWGLITRPTEEQVEARLEEIRLLGRAEFAAMFPDCEIRRERFLGMTKSYLAVRPRRGDAA